MLACPLLQAADVLGDAGKRGEYEAELTQLEFEARLGSEAPGGGIFGGMGAAAAGMAGSNSAGEPGFGEGGGIFWGVNVFVLQGQYLPGSSCEWWLD